jgi:hypothetical protein
MDIYIPPAKIIFAEKESEEINITKEFCNFFFLLQLSWISLGQRFLIWDTRDLRW